MKTICGIDCSKCYSKDNCAGCMATKGHPLGGDCIVAECCHNKGKEQCSECCSGECKIKIKLMQEINELKIKDMPEVTELFELAGYIVNVEYPLPSGESVKFWKNSNIYLGTRLQKAGSNRCFGVAADENYILISEYGENGADPEIILYKKRDK